MHIDRRTYDTSSNRSPDEYLNRAPKFQQIGDNPDKTDLDEIARRITERWRYDTTVNAPSPDNGYDEDDRVLVDDFQPK